MRWVRLVTWVVVAAAAALPGPTAPASPEAPDAAVAQSGERQSRTTDLVAVPELVSFDDLAPTEAAATPHPSTTTPTVRPRRTTPPRPPRTGAVGSSPPAGTPQAVLAAAYRKAVSGASPGCHLQVAHLAAIGQVESGSIGGRTVTSDHRVSPAIYGPLLDGGPFAVVRDSDDGRYDGASDFDRAVGPLQFLPGTWSWAGRDGDADGMRDPQNVYDAAAATADYLCADGRDLARTGDLRSAVLSYNQSGAYRSAVLEWVSYFRRHGLAALTTVAFRVGSGGRASDLAAPPEPKKPPAMTSPAPIPGVLVARSTSTDSPNDPSTQTGPEPSRQPTSPSTPAGTTTSGTSTSDTPLPSPSPTTSVTTAPSAPPTTPVPPTSPVPATTTAPPATP
jgi:membrane-bound lytic murein transglycosylase B